MARMGRMADIMMLGGKCREARPPLGYSEPVFNDYVLWRLKGDGIRM